VKLLGLELDGDVILLEVRRARLLHLDGWTSRVWRACNASTVEEVAATLAAMPERVRGTLEELEQAGVVHREDDRWRREGWKWV
jgi:hypothetical protein